MRLGVAVLVGAVIGCAKLAPEPHGSPPERAPNLPKLVDDLALLAIGALPPAADRQRVAAALARQPHAVDGYITDLLADPRFAQRVAPEILFNKKAVDPVEEDAWDVLDSQGDPPVYYLRHPCDAEHAETVNPWWALDTEVLVCSDSYQPSHLRQPETGWYCGGSNLAPARSPFCGCGPNLMNCARDEAHLRAIKAGLLQELTGTVAWVVAHDRRVSELFRMNETVRTASSELFYMRWEVTAGLRSDVEELAAWRDSPEPSPRREVIAGQHAGLLTSPQVLLFGDTPRARLRNVYDDMWCITPKSVNVTAQAIFDLGVTNLRDGDGWQKLAKMPICGDCHARLDYGMQFFAGYPSSFVGVMYTRAVAPIGVGPLFGHGPTDLRGMAPLTPLGFAGIAVKQPELGRCMVQDVTDHVWNGDSTSEDRRAVANALQKDGTLRAMMREALVRRAEDVLGGMSSREPEVNPMSLGAEVAHHCGSCHGDGPHAFPREGFSPGLLRKMLLAVAFGDMPRAPAELTTVERRVLVASLVRALWGDEPLTKGGAVVLRPRDSRATSPSRFGDPWDA